MFHHHSFSFHFLFLRSDFRVEKREEKRRDEKNIQNEKIQVSRTLPRKLKKNKNKKKFKNK